MMCKLDEIVTLSFEKETKARNLKNERKDKDKDKLQSAATA
jgi:hypothetical protein